MSARWLDAELDGADVTPERRSKPKKKKLLGRRKLDDLTAADPENIADDTIRRLIDSGHITEIVAELKSGKEATAYVARGPRGPVLVKLYRELEARSFKNDAVYREGQVVLDERAARAMTGRSRKGLEMLQGMWVSAEYAHLWTLWRAGLNVPEPLVGPLPFDYDATVPAVLMRLIGTEDSVAPRLSDARLTPAEAQSAWQQSVQGLADLLRLGYAHGDYSTYNLLWWENTVIMIDFPQLTTRQNSNFSELLRRDAQSLATSFRKHGLQTDGETTLREVQRLARGKGPEPRIVLP
ncbi:RIO1 family regulatory kinase/ATPase [Deinococcus radiopugnans]|uniref:non-specific serine/threonine protein kinase n=1 Tax=Deinococcus radiopugnans ATCC 19172 TaxID=585398 RepID=A0A5C4Y927_9DEIO|nr:RIO1 family regulatory kinase/ATPase [Deinococcus radiopugnans]MBB6015818.1 RIO kinase 1 [Deinococcus radiopugnans ATCC 19172]TNM72467.1 serine protein kinase RIO [Deinococcus radiopugnans ATCC 19172]